MVYDLTKEETAVLTSNSIEEQPVEKRLEVLNGVIRADFADKVTMADLDSERRIALGLHPEVQEELTQRQQQEQEILSPLETSSGRRCRMAQPLPSMDGIFPCSTSARAGIGKNGTAGRSRSAK